jgi:YD repeat-containing protein
MGMVLRLFLIVAVALAGLPGVSAPAQFLGGGPVSTPQANGNVKAQAGQPSTDNAQNRLMPVMDCTLTTGFASPREVAAAITFSTSAPALVTRYAYDAMDRVTALTYPGGEVVSYTYNPQALLKTVGSYVTNLTYNARGQTTRIDFGNNVNTQYTYWGDTAGEPASFRLKALLTLNGAQSLQNLSYRYDNIGNVLAVTDTGQTTNFVYDPLDRLTGASGAYSASFDYNAIGNLTRKTEGGITYNLAYTLTRPIHAPGSVNGQAYTYDQNGNLAARPGQSLTYNAENQLTQVVSGTLTTTFTYDGDGRRVKQTVNGVTTTRFIGNHYELNTLYQEDFNDGVADGWTAYSGTWAVQSNAYRQSNTTYTNTNAYCALTQNQALVYRWTITFTTGTQAGVYLYASSNTGTERGNAYRVWQDATNVKIYESVGDVAYQRASFTAANAARQSHSYRVAYDPATGKLEVWRDNVYLGSWTDTSPLTSGAYLSLRTTSTEARFDNLVVEGQVKYYYANSRRVAMRTAAGVTYIHSDHPSASLRAGSGGHGGHQRGTEWRHQVLPVWGHAQRRRVHHVQVHRPAAG